MERETSSPEPAPAPAGATTDRMQDGPPISPAGRRPMAVAAWVCAVLAPLLVGYGVVLGILGMVLGSGAYLKGDRHGMPAAIVAGVSTVAAMALVFLLRPP